ncbi:MAG: HlyD family efflux transporter periplasmic adaptor subunit [Planctomycetaceae bacterium]|nr:HlyD family efflux transporter periplasmic adaptor subunit [Planctomycetaceae bacterium]
MKRRRNCFARAMLVLTLFVAGDRPASEAQVADDTLPVARRVKFGLIRQSEIPSRDAGTVGELRVKEGAAVRQGDILFVLDSEEQQLAVTARRLALQIARLKAEDDLPLQSAKAQLQEAKAAKEVAGVRLEIAETEAESSAAVDIASAETRLRQLELERAEKARESFRSAISGTQIDRLKTSVRKGELEIQQAKENLDVSRLKPEAERAAVRQKEQEIQRYQTAVGQEQASRVVAGLTRDVQENELQIAQARLDRRYIRAPFDGVMMRVDVNPGEWVEPGTVVGRVIDLSRLRAEGFVRVSDVDPEFVGRTVSIEVRSDAETYVVRGQITFVSREVDPQNQEVRFYAEVDNRDGRLLPGMHGQLSIIR